MGWTKFLLLPSSASLVVPVSLISLNTNLSDEIVLATYQSYINTEIADEAFNDYSLKTIYFENDKEVFNGFASGAFDLAVLSSSTLEEAIEKNLAKKIEWNKFNSIKSKLENGVSADTTQNGKISEKLGKIYSPVVAQFFKNSEKLAEYGIPYFISYLAFAYRGKPLIEGDSITSESAPAKNGEQKPMSWNELISKISKDNRFRTKNDRPKLGMVEDELTLFSLSKLSNQITTGTDSSTVEDLFTKESKSSEDEFYNQYMQINQAGINKEKLGHRPLFFSPDSVVLSKALSDGDLEGIFFYNGDALYAHQMLQEKQEESEDDSETEINIVPLTPALWLMDSIAISSKVSLDKEERIYKFLEKLSFKNFEKLKELDRKEELGDDEEDEEEDEEEDKDSQERPKWLLDNYKEIGYTPVLSDFNKWIKGELKNEKEEEEQSSNVGDEGFYKKEQEFLYGKPDIEKCLVGQPQLTSQPSGNNGKCSIVFERGLNDSQNLNLTLAFERWKNNF